MLVEMESETAAHAEFVTGEWHGELYLKDDPEGPFGSG